MGSLCIIPARGGSKRIAKKNIKDFLGFPIVSYSIKVAIASKLFDDVIVSTDNDEIKLIAEKYGASVPFLRSEINSNDQATTLDVLYEVIEKLSSDNEKYDFICCLYPTAPFVNKVKLFELFDHLKKGDYSCTFPLVAYNYPIQRALRIVGENNNVQMKWSENRDKRSQDLEVLYHDAGQFYWYTAEFFRKGIRDSFENAGGIPYPEDEVQDIDNEVDWRMAEIKYEVLQRK